MGSISHQEIEYLRNNINTGIEFEYALFFLLHYGELQNVFLNEVVLHHPFKDRIEIIIANTNIGFLKQMITQKFNSDFEVFLATQVDNVGPSDIILQDNEGCRLGLSVKYQNNCTLNVSSKYFITEQSAMELKNALKISCQNYIVEMNAKFGSTNEWFRKRKISTETDRFIDNVRNMVLQDWMKKSTIEKEEILNKLVHADSPINFWVVKFRNSQTGFQLEINENPIKKFLPDDVVLTKEATSFIGFNINGILFARMQVKFNNGILEKAKGKYSDFIIDGIKMKNGDPFGSWNFSI